MLRLHFAIAIVFLAYSSASAAEDLSVLPAGDAATSPRGMMHRFLRAEQQRAAERATQAYEARSKPEEIAAYQREMRAFLVAQLGGFPERTPLNAHTTGRVPRDGFSVEKVIFESQPKHFVTAALFLPDEKRHAPPYPGVIVPCGHSVNGKGAPLYQKACALLALNGIAALCFDPIDQGERFQLLDDAGKPLLGGTGGHSMIGVGSMLLGRNTARFEVWDGMRAIDYLQSRKDIDPKKIGCLGNSGGGTQTAYLVALDDRISAAAPSCYITSFERLIATIGPQDAEQNIFGQLERGLDHADYLMLRAPTPTLVCCATRDFFDIRGTWDSFRIAKRLYSRLGYSERIELIEHDDKHGFNQPLREAAARWMLRWLAGKDSAITEPPIDVLTDSEIQCTPRGQVMLLPEARNVYDLNRDEAKRLHDERAAAAKNQTPELRRDAIRKLTGIREVGQLPGSKLESVGNVKRKGYHIEKHIIRTEEGIALPALAFIPLKRADREDPANRDLPNVVLYLHEQGKQAEADPEGEIEKIVLSGTPVLAVDLRGMGETHANPAAKPDAPFGGDSGDVYLAYLLGKSYVALRAEDVLYARGVATILSDRKPPKIKLIAIGNAGLPALHAAALEPDLFSSVELRRTLGSWHQVIDTPRTTNQLVSAIHGALRLYDLPDLAALLGDKLRLLEPVDANGKVIDPKE